MPPKAALRRPAGRGNGGRAGLRRPAAALEAGQPKRRGGGLEMELCQLPIGEVQSLGSIFLKEAVYYHRKIEVVGRVAQVRVEHGQTYIELDVTGTQDEGLLKVLTGKEDRMIKVHLCAPDCDNSLTGEYLIHGKAGIKVEEKALPLYTNVVKVPGREERGVDEMESLRLEQERLRRDEGRLKEASPKRKKKEKKAKESKKEKKADREEAKGKSSAEESATGGKKSLRALYGHTGLDPDAQRRKKIMKKAQRIGRSKKKGKKKKDSSASSSSSSSGSKSDSTSEGEGGGLFDSQKKIKTLWERYPGALTCNSLQEAQRHLVTSSGTMWQLDKTKLAPLMTHLARQNLMPIMSAPMAQEALTIAMTLDLLLQGQPASACDILSQRLKSLEAIARNTHWSVARQLKLVKADGLALTEDSESIEAARRAREEARLSSMMSKSPFAGAGDYRNSGGKGKKGKDSKGSGKGKADEGGRQKGGDGKREEHRREWPKKDK